MISSLDDGSHVIGTMIYTVQTLASGSWRVVGVSFVQEIIRITCARLRGFWRWRPLQLWRRR